MTVFALLSWMPIMLRSAVCFDAGWPVGACQFTSVGDTDAAPRYPKDRFPELDCSTTRRVSC